MKYLDTNVFLYYILNPESDKNGIASKNIISKVAEGLLPAATSTLTWNEIVWTIKKKAGFELAKRKGARFLEFPNLKLLGVSENTLSSAQYLMGRYSLKPRDAIHAACCIENGIEEIISDDPDFDGIMGLKRIKLENI
jgi:uncharacterized protein